MNARTTHPTAPLKALLLPRVNELARRIIGTPGLELTFNARGALLTAFSEIASSGAGSKVLLPAFHCPSAVSPALHAGLQPVFYRIGRDLSIDYEDLMSKADTGIAAVLVIHFFGIAADLAPLAALRGAGVKIVEDCSHSFLAVDPIRLTGHTDSDYRIYSFWKTAPSGVGGGLLRSAATLMKGTSTQRGKAPLAARARNYKRLIEESVEHSNHRILRSVMRSVEAARMSLKPTTQGAVAPVRPDPMRGEDYYPIEPHVSSGAMPGHSRRIIESLNLEVIANQRRANFARYSAQAGSLNPMQPLVTSLPRSTCPWVYPVLLHNRSNIDFNLKAAGVQLHTFGIYLHSALFRQTDALTVSNAQFLANELLCLSVHQDMTTSDIDQAVEVIQREVRNHPRRS